MENIFHCFSSLGPEVKSLRTFAVSFQSGFGVNPVMTPVWLRKKPRPTQVRELTQWFNRSIKSRGFHESAPYFNLLIHPKIQFQAFRKKLQQAKWRKLSGTEYLLYWNKPISLELPHGIRVLIGEPSDNALWKQFEKINSKNFKADRAFNKALKESCLAAPGKHYIVVAQSDRGEAVAAGMVAVNGRHAFLYTTSVVPRWRGKGLWKALVAIRQIFTASLGAEHWVTTTFNPYLQKASVGAKKYRIETWMAR